MKNVVDVYPGFRDNPEILNQVLALTKEGAICWEVGTRGVQAILSTGDPDSSSVVRIEVSLERAFGADLAAKVTFTPGEMCPSDEDDEAQFVSGDVGIMVSGPPDHELYTESFRRAQAHKERKVQESIRDAEVKVSEILRRASWKVDNLSK